MLSVFTPHLICPLDFAFIIQRKRDEIIVHIITCFRSRPTPVRSPRYYNRTIDTYSHPSKIIVELCTLLYKDAQAEESFMFENITYERRV